MPDQPVGVNADVPMRSSGIDGVYRRLLKASHPPSFRLIGCQGYDATTGCAQNPLQTQQQYLIGDALMNRETELSSSRCELSG